MDGAFVIPIIILVVVGFVALAIYMEHLRRQFWREVAAEYGLSYTPGDPLALVDGQPFGLFSQGHSRRVLHTAHGDCGGRHIILFDYTYKTGSGKNQSTHNHCGLIADMPIAGRRLSVRPENFLDRFASFVGFDDINFELEEFNRAFRVNCDDKKFAYDVFHSGMMEYLLGDRSAAFEWQGRSLLISSTGHSTKEGIRRAMTLSSGIIERLPEYLLASRG